MLNYKKCLNCIFNKPYKLCDCIAHCRCIDDEIICCSKFETAHSHPRTNWTVHFLPVHALPSKVELLPNPGDECIPFLLVSNLCGSVFPTVFLRHTDKLIFSDIHTGSAKSPISKMPFSMRSVISSAIALWILKYTNGCNCRKFLICSERKYILLVFPQPMAISPDSAES